MRHIKQFKSFESLSGGTWSASTGNISAEQQQSEKKHPELEWQEKLVDLTKSGDIDGFMKHVGPDINVGGGRGVRVIPLATAIKYGNLDFVRQIVEAGADISLRRYFAVRVAAGYGKADILEYLLELCETQPFDYDTIKYYVGEFIEQELSLTKRNEIMMIIKEIYQEKGWDM